MNKKTIRNIINFAYSVLQITLIVAFTVRREYFSVVGTIFVFIVYMVFIFYEQKKGVKTTDFIRILVLVTVLSNSFLGEYMRLYTTSLYFDKFLHIFGTFSLSIFTFSLIEKSCYITVMSKFIIFIFMLLFGNFIGTIFEIGEFICDLIFKTVNQNGLFDTNVDIICNILGAALAGIYAAYKKVRRQPNS